MHDATLDLNKVVCRNHFLCLSEVQEGGKELSDNVTSPFRIK